MRCDKAEDFIGFLRHGGAAAVEENHQQCAEQQEQGDDEELKNTADNHVFLRLLRVLAGEVSLHHVLVEAVDGDGHEHAGQELFPEIGALLGVVEEEHPRGLVLLDGADHLAEREAEVLRHEIDAQNHRHDEAEALEGIGPDEGLHAALHGVEPDEGDGDDDVEHERDVERREHQQLQHGTDHKEAHGRAQNLRDEEQPRARAVGVGAETLLEVAVDGYEVALVEQRHQQEGYHEVAHNEAEHHLEVGVALGGHHAGNGYERYARDGGTDHGEGDHRPGGLTVAGEECVVVGAARGKPRHYHQQDKIARDGQYDDDWL